jgi:RNA polymerase sigma-70 factor (ECF subfamily)
VAVGFAFGPEAGLAVLDAAAGTAARGDADPGRSAAGGPLADYHLAFSVRGDLLAKAGRSEEARAAFTRAARLTRNERERTLLLARAAAAAADA